MNFNPKIERISTQKEFRTPDTRHLHEKIDAINVVCGEPRDNRLRQQISDLTLGHTIKGVMSDAVKNGKKLPDRMGLIKCFASHIDSDSKFTRGLNNCLSVIAVGRDKVSGEEISFISHQSPDGFSSAAAVMFLALITTKLMELKARAEEGSIDVVILGGNYIDSTEDEYSYKKNYRDVVKTLSDEVSSVLKFRPAIIGGPKFRADTDDIYLDTTARKAYLLRHSDNTSASQNDYMEPFFAEDLDRLTSEWDKKLSQK